MNLRIGLTRDHPAFNNGRQFSSCRRLETHFGRCVSLSNGEWRGIPRWLGWHGLMRRTFSPSLLLRQLLSGPKQFDDLCEHQGRLAARRKRNHRHTSEICGDDA
jgi:hypothetical protein